MLGVFEAAGLRVGEPRLLDEVTFVEQVMEFDVGGSPVRILEFDLSEQSQTQGLERIHRDGTTCLFGAAPSAENNGPIVIVNPERHPSKEKPPECFRTRRMTIKPYDP